MNDVEFVEPPADGPGDPAERPEDLDVGGARAGPAGRPAVAVLTTGLPFLAAAALLVVAAFRTVVAFRVGGGGAFSYAVDGWGRYRDLGSDTTFTAHATRYGIVLVVVAGVYVLLALRVLVAVLAPGRAARRLGVAGRLAGGAFGVLVGVIVTGALQVDSVVASTRAALGTRGSGGTLHVTVGACGWLSLAAAGFGLLGAAGLRHLPATDRSPNLFAEIGTARLV